MYCLSSLSSFFVCAITVKVVPLVSRRKIEPKPRKRMMAVNRTASCVIGISEIGTPRCDFSGLQI